MGGISLVSCFLQPSAYPSTPMAFSGERILKCRRRCSYQGKPSSYEARVQSPSDGLVMKAHQQTLQGNRERASITRSPLSFSLFLLPLTP